MNIFKQVAFSNVRFEDRYESHPVDLQCAAQVDFDDNVVNFLCDLEHSRQEQEWFAPEDERMAEWVHFWREYARLNRERLVNDSAAFVATAILYELGALTTDEIAEAMGVQKNTIYVRMARFTERNKLASKRCSFRRPRYNRNK